MRELRMSEGRRVGTRGAALAFYLDNFEGGGVQKTTLTLAGALAARGRSKPAAPMPGAPRPRT
jgi:hypothetical protein